jgi:mono/diheme cytochrome c family protein
MNGWVCRSLVTVWIALAAVRTALAAEPAAPPARPLPPAAERPVDFVRDIQPILAERCNHCHGEDEQQGQLRLDAQAIVRRGGKSGPLLIAGQSAQSLLIERLVGTGPGKQMPLEDDPLSSEQIGLLRAWIDQGAPWPDGVGSAATELKKHWAYRTPVSPPLPAVRDTAWAATAIDRFVLARLEQDGLAPSAPASRERLLRRVSLDLVGLPPSIAEVDAFLASDGPRRGSTPPAMPIATATSATDIARSGPIVIG